MSEEEKRKHHILKFIGIILATFIGAFLAFYLAVDLTLNRMLNPEYQMKKMEKMVQKQERNIQKYEDKILDQPFEPKMAPMLVNLVKESDEYKIIVDLKPLGGNDKNINVKLNENVITISGEIEKKELRGEKIMNFSQAYYLDEKLKSNEITKERKGNKYIITIPFED